ncbi:hypothetical protein COLO4_07450 [Corchorus olitorius]|uniref:Uncharacterized protein n=1 Tax=Corchorus olitorius TaxID=93759 RepID=A0A1R3KJQ4_9ROSI|nr:hypothetical protein COLO4_07450 [Corchorus olitorius]
MDSNETRRGVDCLLRAANATVLPRGQGRAEVTIHHNHPAPKKRSRAGTVERCGFWHP